MGPLILSLVSAVTMVPEPEKKLVYEVQTICWLLAVNPPTNTAGKRSFPSARPLKTWLRSRMDDETFSSLCLSRLSVIRTKSGRAPSRLLTFCPTDREPATGYSSLAVLNGHKQRTETNGVSTESVCIADVAQEFVSRNENRKRNFSNFKK